MVKEKENFQIPFRYNKEEHEILEWLKEHYHEATISKTIKRCLENVKDLIEFKKEIEKAITKEVKFKIDQEFVKKTFRKFSYMY